MSWSGKQQVAIRIAAALHEAVLGCCALRESRTVLGMHSEYVRFCPSQHS